MIEIYNIDNTLLRSVVLTKEAVHEQELMKSNFIRLAWNDRTLYTLPVGAYIIVDGVKYMLLDPYTPKNTRHREFRYEPEFQHPTMWLTRLPFYAQQNGKKYDFTYANYPSTIANYLCDVINDLNIDYLNSKWDANERRLKPVTWDAVVDSSLQVTGVCAFNSVDLFSAAGVIANTFDCQFNFDYESCQLRVGNPSDDFSLKFEQIGYQPILLKSGVNTGVASVSESKEDFHNAFYVQGSTRNLSKVSDSGMAVQVTERLTLDPVQYPDSVIYTDGNGHEITKAQFDAMGVPALMKSLIFDNIYPKYNLYLYNIRERRCWLLDDDGNKTETTSSDGWLDTTDDKYYKYYSKWYIRLAYYSYEQISGKTILNTEIFKGKTIYWYDFELTQEMKIADMPLSIAFQPNYDATGVSSPLASREFTLVDFHASGHEKEDDDIEGGMDYVDGDYRIEPNEEAGIRLPSTYQGGMYPKPKKRDSYDGDTNSALPSINNNIGTLFNISIDNQWKVTAQGELKEAALNEIAYLAQDLNKYTVPSDPTRYTETLDLGQRVTYDNGQDQNPHTSRHYTLDTQVLKLVTRLDKPEYVTITVGNEKTKGAISTMKEQIETIIAGGLGNGEGGITEKQFQKLLILYGDKRYIRRDINDETDTDLTANRFIAKTEVKTDKIVSKTGNAPVAISKVQVEGTTNTKGVLTADDTIRAKKNIVVGADVDGSIEPHLKDESIMSSIYNAGFYGWRIDANGNLEVASIKVRGYAKFNELRVNRMQAQEGDTIYTDNDQIEEVEVVEGTPTTYILTFKEKWDGYFTAQKYGNILKGIINTLAEAELAEGEGRDPAVDPDSPEWDEQESDSGNNKYFTSWMRVVGDRNTEQGILGKNQVRVILYGDSDIAQDKNFAPCEKMVVGRWGCYNYSIDPVEVEDIKKRQTFFYLSSSEGRFMKLRGVNKPILEEGNFGMVFGNTPDFLKQKPFWSDLVAQHPHLQDRDYLFAQGLIYSDLVPVNMAGEPIPVVVYCGDWVDGTNPSTMIASETEHVFADEYGNVVDYEVGDPVPLPKVTKGIYYNSHWNEATGRFETHTVRYSSGTWMCLQNQPVVENGVKTYYKPSWGNRYYWKLVDGNEHYSIELKSSNGDKFRQGTVDTIIEPHLFYGNVELTIEDVPANQWKWTRQSEHGTKTTADESWDADHIGVKNLHMTDLDMPVGWSVSNRAIFTVTAVVSDGKTDVIVDNYVIR